MFIIIEGSIYSVNTVVYILWPRVEGIECSIYSKYTVVYAVVNLWYTLWPHIEGIEGSTSCLSFSLSARVCVLYVCTYVHNEYVYTVATN